MHPQVAGVCSVCECVGDATLALRKQRKDLLSRLLHANPKHHGSTERAGYWCWERAVWPTGPSAHCLGKVIATRRVHGRGASKYDNSERCYLEKVHHKHGGRRGGVLHRTRCGGCPWALCHPCTTACQPRRGPQPTIWRHPRARGGIHQRCSSHSTHRHWGAGHAASRPGHPMTARRPTTTCPPVAGTRGGGGKERGLCKGPSLYESTLAVGGGA